MSSSLPTYLLLPLLLSRTDPSLLFPLLFPLPALFRILFQHPQIYTLPKTTALFVDIAIIPASILTIKWKIQKIHTTIPTIALGIAAAQPTILAIPYVCATLGIAVTAKYPPIIRRIYAGAHILALYICTALEYTPFPMQAEYIAIPALLLAMPGDIAPLPNIPAKIGPALLIIAGCIRTNYLSLPLFLLGITSQWKGKHIAMKIYFAIYVLIQAAVNTRLGEIKLLDDIGLTPYGNHAAWYLGAQLFLCLLYLNTEEKSPTAAPSPAHPDVESEVSVQPANNFLTLTKAALRSYAYIISLVLIALGAVFQVNILQVPFIVASIVFTVFPKVAQKGWRYLIIYTEIVMLLNVLWQYEWARAADPQHALLWGLMKFDIGIWHGLRFYLISLVFMLIQQDVYRTQEALPKRERSQHATPYRSRQNSSVHTAQVTPNGAESRLHSAAGSDLALLAGLASRDEVVIQVAQDPDSDEEVLDSGLKNRVVRWVAQLRDYTLSAMEHYMILACYLSMAIKALISSPTLIDLGYLSIVFACLIIHHYDEPDLIRRLWPLVICYTGITSATIYVCQFPQLYETLEGAFPHSLADIGIMKMEPGWDLVSYYLPHIIIFVCCVVQYRFFSKRKDQWFGSSRGAFHWDQFAWNRGRTLPRPLWVSYIGSLFQRVVVIHIDKIIWTLTFISAIKNVSLVGFALMTLVLISVQSRYLSAHLSGIILMTLQAHVTLNLALQIPLFGTITRHAEALKYIGFCVIARTSTSHLKLEIVLSFILGFRFLWKRWKRRDFLNNTQLPRETNFWPLIPEYCVSPRNSAVSQESEDSLPELNNDSAHVLEELNSPSPERISALSLINKYISTIFINFGYEICLLAHMLVALQRIGAFGVAYACLFGLWLALPIKWVARVWPYYLLMLTLSIACQYMLSTGPPPWTDWLNYLPWYGFPPTTKYVLGLPIGREVLFLPDFFLLLLCAQLQKVFALAPEQEEAIERLFVMPIETEFTAKLDIGINRLKLWCCRHCSWISIILIFAAGTVQVEFISLPFLLFSLYFISEGETLMLRSKKAIRRWSAVLWLVFAWVLLNVVWQVPAYAMNLQNQQLVTKEEVDQITNHPTQWSWRRLIGLRRRRNGAYLLGLVCRDTDIPAFDGAIITIIFVFITVILQRRLQESDTMAQVVRHIKLGLDSSKDTAEAYRQRSLQEIKNTRQEYETKVAELRKKVTEVAAHRDEVKDWITLFDMNTVKEGRKHLHLTRPDLVLEPEEDMMEAAQISRDSPVTLPPEDTTEPPVEEPPPLEKQRGFADLYIYPSILSLYNVSYDYRQLHPKETALYKNLDLAAVRLHPYRTIAHALLLVLMAKTVNFAFFSIFLNQIIRKDLLSTIPAMAILLIGVCQRPRPTKRFWQFIIYFIEFDIIAKYLANFIISNVPNAPSLGARNILSVIGLYPRAEVHLFTSVISQLTVIVFFMVHQSAMYDLGLWYNGTETVGSEDGNRTQELQQINTETSHTPVEEVRSRNAIARVFVRYTRLFRSITSSKGLLGGDHYLGMFVADLIVFLITIFSWTSFSGDSGDDDILFLKNVFSQNTVPPLFIALAIANFLLILTDRIIYTSKNLTAKYVMQYVTVIGFHIWIFFVLPSQYNIGSKGREQKAVTVAIWYLVKCIYWYLSGQQLKSGYPAYRISHFLMRNFSNFNRLLFLGYRALPFVFELRSIIDWTITPTTMTLYRWLKFEDIYANLYAVTCAREYEKNDPRPFGVAQNKVWQRLTGFLLIILIALVLWFPLLLLAIPGSTKPNPATSVMLDIRLNTYVPFYQQSIGDLPTMTTQERDAFFADRREQGLPNAMGPENIQKIIFPTPSMTTWGINQPSKQALLQALKANNTQLTISWSILRNNPPLAKSVSGRVSKQLTIEDENNFIYLIGSPTPIKAGGLINGEPPPITSVPLQRSINVTFKDFPSYLHARAKGGIEPITRSLQLGFTYRDEGDADSGWFEVRVLNKENEQGHEPYIFLLSDNVPSYSSLGSIGVLGLYVAVVLAVGRLLRSGLSNLTFRIMYEDLPDAREILQMCHDIYICREFDALDTEELLFWQLVTLFRSPQQLIELTRLRSDKKDV